MLDEKSDMTVVNEGGSFGLEPLLFCTPAEYSARAVSHVDILTFKRLDFVKVVKSHPHDLTKIQDIALKEYGMPLKLS